MSMRWTASNLKVVVHDPDGAEQGTHRPARVQLRDGIATLSVGPGRFRPVLQMAAQLVEQTGRKLYVVTGDDGSTWVCQKEGG